MTPSIALGVCEVHWRPIRLYALQLANAGCHVELLLRGPVTPDTLPLVPPHPKIRWRVVSRPALKWVALWLAALQMARHREALVFFDRPRLWRLACRLIWWAHRHCQWISADAEQGFRVASCGARSKDLAPPPHRRRAGATR